MRFLMTFLLLTICAGAVCANNFYETTNPFPTKTNSPEFNNIYATDAQAEAREEYGKKKSGFWNKKNKVKNEVNEVKEVPANVNEGVQQTWDGRFYMFTTK